MDSEEFKEMCQSLFEEFRNTLVPNPKTRYHSYVNAYGNKVKGSTGNMALNAAQISFPSDDVCEITIDDKIAPYVPYTNEPWVSPYWGGKKNPNEGWFGRAAETLVNIAATRLNGTKE